MTQDVMHEGPVADRLLLPQLSHRVTLRVTHQALHGGRSAGYNKSRTQPLQRPVLTLEGNRLAFPAGPRHTMTGCLE